MIFWAILIYMYSDIFVIFLKRKLIGLYEEMLINQIYFNNILAIFRYILKYI